MSIVVFGGSFDPVHLGHVAVIRAVKQYLGACRVLLVPTRQSPHKKAAPFFSNERRLEMLGVVAREEGCEVWEGELRREGLSYSVDTLREICQETDDVLYLVVGWDQYEVFHEWEAFEEILSMAVLLVLNRRGDQALNGTLRQVQDERGLGSRVRFVVMDEVAVSSTEVRGKLDSGESLSGLVSEGVLGMIGL